MIIWWRPSIRRFTTIPRHGNRDLPKGAGFNQPIEKINCLDALLHQRFVRFEDLCRLGAAELGLAMKKVMPRLDPGRPLLLFADHGFRIGPDGDSFQHGGPSALERIVPVLRLEPGR
ncbi:MAG: type II toxin-antitoxin system HicA family toxin [Planctomycetes bacterium]|nr:type II toxin-antitoxin system HicA family toxin [Planctomycetota bacterium]